MGQTVCDFLRELDILKGIVLEIIIVILTNLIGILKSRQVIVARMSDRKNGKIIDDVILNKVKDESMRSFLKKSCKYWIDMLLVPMVPILQLLIYGLGLLFLNIRFGVMLKHQSIYIVLGVVLGSALVARVLAQMPFKDSNIIKWSGFAFIESTLFILILSMLVNKKGVYHFFVVCVTLLWIIILLVFLDKIVFAERYRDRYIHISEGIRYIILLVWSFLVVGNATIFTYVYLVWLLLTSIEYLVVMWKDDTEVVDVVIHLKNANRFVREAIVQCYDKRVMYVTKDRMHQFVDVEEINYISYKLNKCWKKRKGNDKKVLCVLKNGTELYYQSFYYMNKEWISFSNGSDRHREIHIYHIGKIDRFCEIV